LQQIYIVHGRPGMYTEIKVALVMSRGHEVWVEDISDTRAVVCGRRKGSEAPPERVTVTMDQARKAGWTTNQAYAKTPQDMLYARAAGRVCDRIAPDVLMGIASVEEIRDSIQTTAEVGSRTVEPPTRQRLALNKKRAEERAANLTPLGTVEYDPPLGDPVEEALLQEEPWPTVQTQPAPTANQPSPDEQTSTSPTREAGATRRQIAEEDSIADDIIAESDAAYAERKAAEAEALLPVVGDITGAQSRMMYGLLHTTDREDREVALVYISGVIGREIGSTKELSKGEAKKVIDALNLPHIAAMVLLVAMAAGTVWLLVA
jgi:hypothetical protein